MQITDILFSLHSYDQDGDIKESGIFLHFGEVRIKVANDPQEFILVADRIKGMANEIIDQYRLS